MTGGRQNTRTVRLEVRLTAEQKAIIERAAAYKGLSISAFVVQRVQEAAKSVIQQHEEWRLTRTQSELLVEALLRPPAPNSALRRAARQYRRDVDSQ